MKFEMATIANAMKNFVNIRQKDDESLIMVAQIGEPIGLKYMKAHSGIDKSTAFETLIAYFLLENADKARYGSLLNSLQSQFILGNDQYPTSLIHANQVLSNQILDASWTRKKRIDGQATRSSNATRARVIICSKNGN